jgi:hypothetical protein
VNASAEEQGGGMRACWQMTRGNKTTDFEINISMDRFVAQSVEKKKWISC